MKNKFNSKVSLIWMVGFAVLTNLYSFPAKASNEVQLVALEQVTECKKIGVYRGKADQPLFSQHTLEQLEKEALDELVEEAKDADATHLVKGFTYRIANGRSEQNIKMVFQFGIAYDYSSKQ